MAVIVDGTTLSALTSTSGTWTPTLENGTTNSVTAKYVKVGVMCHCRCSFYLTSSESDRSDTVLKLTGLPFTSASSHSYAGGGYSHGVSSTMRAFVSVESASTTAIFQFNANNPNSIVWTGSRARRHSYSDGSGDDNWYSIFVTYATAS